MTTAKSPADASASARKSKNRQRNRKTREEWLPKLIATYPKAFFEDARERKPLKIGIHADILADGAAELSGYQVTGALRWYTGALGYQKALTEGAARVDLAGAEVGAVTAEEAAAAKTKIKDINERRNAKREERQQADQAERWMAKLSRLTGQ